MEQPHVNDPVSIVAGELAEVRARGRARWTAADEPPVERPPGGNDLSLLREMLALTPEQSIERTVRWLALVEALRAWARRRVASRRVEPPAHR